jgi:rhodanese-related sulfurtransferase
MLSRSLLTCVVAVSLALAAPALAAQARKAAAPADEFDPVIARRISVEDLRARLEAGEKVVYVDNRYKPTGPIVQGAHLVMEDAIAAWAKDVPKDALIVNYCTCHNETSSVRAVLALQKLGFTNAYALLGGLVAYQAAGLPTQPAPQH